MKVTYVEEHTPLSPLNRSHYCACGNHSPRLVEQIEPYTQTRWRVECPDCGRETAMYMTPGGAKMAWDNDILC